MIRWQDIAMLIAIGAILVYIIWSVEMTRHENDRWETRKWFREYTWWRVNQLDNEDDVRIVR